MDAVPREPELFPRDPWHHSPVIITHSVGVSASASVTATVTISISFFLSLPVSQRSVDL